MIRPRIIYKLIVLFLIFAVLIVLPLTMTFIKQVDRLIAEEEAVESHQSEEYAELHEKFSSRLVEQVLPYAVYILVMVIIMSIFFMRTLLLSLSELRRGAQELRDGNLEVSINVYSDDELGDVTQSFNDMALSLKEKTEELKKKDVYINAMLDPLWVVDENNAVQDINPAFTRLFGYTLDDVDGVSVYDFFDERNVEIMRRQLSEKRDKGISSIYEISIIAKDGSQVPVLISGSPIFSDGKIVGKIGILKDFREQLFLRNELQQSRDYLEKIMDSIQDSLLVIDCDYRIVRANAASVKGGSKVPVVGQFCHSVSHGSEKPCWAEGVDCPVRAVFASGKSFSTVHHHGTATGEFRHHEVIASPVFDASGNVVHVIELVRDVSERIANERTLYRKNVELMTLNSIAGLLGKSLMLSEIFLGVLEKLLTMMSMDGGGIYFLDQERKELICQYHRGISDEYMRMMGRVRVGDDLPGKVAVTGEILTSSDLTQDGRVEHSPLRHSGIRGYVAIPIRGKERILGVICLFTFKPRSFVDEEEKILNSIGEMTGIALENIRLYEEMRNMYEEQTARREEEHAQLLSLSTILGSTLEIQEVMQHILEKICSSFRVDFAWTLLEKEQSGLFLCAASKVVGQEGEMVYQQDDSSLEAYALEKKAPTVVHGFKKESRFYSGPVIGGASYETAVAVPLYIGSVPIGVLTLYSAYHRNYSEDEIYFLEIIGNMIAVAIQRSEIYENAIIEKGLADTILQSVNDSIVTVDRRGRTIAANRALERITGLSFLNVPGRTIADIFGFSRSNEEFISILRGCVDEALQGKGATREGALVTRFGNRIPVVISSDPVRDADGNVIGAVNLIRDVRKEKEIDRMKTELIRSVSHEFRTPLSAIVGMTEMIIDGDLSDEKARKYLDVILSEGVRLSNMISELLNIARIESGKESLNLKSVNMEELVGSVLEACSSLIRKKQATVTYSIGDVGECVADEDKIKQLIINLLDNSLTFSDEECNINLSVARNNDDIELVVSDNGWGIPEDEIPHLFERFYRGKHGEKLKGTGLGLSLCDDIVKMHGGRMKITSTYGAGTEVTVLIPDRSRNE